MRMLKPGDPCPLCGQSLPEGLPLKTMIYLSCLDEGLKLIEATEDWSEDIDAE